MHTAMNKIDFIHIFEKQNQPKQDHLFQSKSINISIVYFFVVDLTYPTLSCCVHRSVVQSRLVLLRNAVRLTSTKIHFEVQIHILLPHPHTLICDLKHKKSTRNLTASFYLLIFYHFRTRNIFYPV